MQKLIFIFLMSSISYAGPLKNPERTITSYTRDIERLQIQEGEYKKISGPDDCSEGVVRWIDVDPPVLMIGTNLSFPLVPKGSRADEEHKNCTSSYEVEIAEKFITKKIVDTCNKNVSSRKYDLLINGDRITYNIYLLKDKSEEELLATCVLKKSK